MANILNSILGSTPSRLQPIASAASNLLSRFTTNGHLDVTALGAHVAGLKTENPALAANLLKELAPTIAQWKPLEQGLFQKQVEPTKTAPGGTPSSSLPDSAPLIPFAETGGTDWDSWLAAAKAAPAGTSLNQRYHEMVRIAGTDNPVVLKMVMQENYESRATVGTIQDNKTPGSKPLSGFELRFRMEGNRTQVLSNAAAEIGILVPAITALETKPNPSATDQAEAATLRNALQPAMNRYALASDNPSALRQTGFANDPRFADNLAVAEAYRKAGDMLAQDQGGRQGLEGNVAEAATRIRSVAGADKYDAYLDSTISAASIKYIPATLTTPEARTNIIRQLGIGRERATIEIARPLNEARSPFGFSPDLAGAIKAETSFRVGNNVLEQAALDSMAKPDYDALKWGVHAALGREFFMDYAGIMTGGMVGVMARAARGPIRITAETLDAKGMFLGTHNAGLNTPRFDRWIKTGGIVELMPGGQVRYTRMIDDPVVLRITRGGPASVNYTNGYPDFTPYMRHPSGVRSVRINVTGIDRTDVRNANIAAGHPEWKSQPPEGWTWHHHEDTKTMQLVPRAINSGFDHLGGASKARNLP